jgi:hypothetical protein
MKVIIINDLGVIPYINKGDSDLVSMSQNCARHKQGVLYKDQALWLIQNKN